MTARLMALRRLLSPRFDVNRPDLPVLSVYREHGVVPKDSRSDNFNKTPEDVGRYLHVRPGDLVVNKMKAWSGSVGVSSHEGIVSGDYLVCAVSPLLDARFLHHVLRSEYFIGEMRTRSKGIRPSQERLYWDDLGEIEVPMSDLSDQRRIADFLDEQVARIDRVVSMRLEQAELLSASHERRVLRMIAGEDMPGDRMARGLDWLGPIPQSWPVVTVASQFEVLLGKMLNEERSSGLSLRPYLRNTNVQWDRVDVEDLKEMNFAQPERRRYEVLSGDLLICEGGQPGRAAIWDGRTGEIYYQKALHRARSRGRSLPRWLYYCLFAAVSRNAFGPASGQTTIAHLTGEQLRAQKFPFPEPDEQQRRVTQLDESGTATHGARGALAEWTDLLAERKRALITAVVRGEFDVPSASTRAAAAVTG